MLEEKFVRPQEYVPKPNALPMKSKIVFERRVSTLNLFLAFQNIEPLNLEPARRLKIASFISVFRPNFAWDK